MYTMFTLISLRKNYVTNPAHIVDLDGPILVDQNEFQMGPNQIIDTKVRPLRQRTVKDVLITMEKIP